jgi:hypothetical protein
LSRRNRNNSKHESAFVKIILFYEKIMYEPFLLEENNYIYIYVCVCVCVCVCRQIDMENALLCDNIKGGNSPEYV